mmetsp:Transcript_27432/g.44012  ORF Transcript_27432/g.44012 Transcript_27432/m.44012 type:complete len:159 (+) Transcript_27432:84-560(+)
MKLQWCHAAQILWAVTFLASAVYAQSPVDTAGSGHNLRRIVAVSMPSHQAQAFIQRAASHSSKRQTRSYHPVHHSAPILYEPRDIEDMETIWGVPKIIWVLLADVLAMAAFLSCIPLVMYLAKRRRPEMGGPEPGGPLACLYPPEKSMSMGHPGMSAY